MEWVPAIVGVVGSLVVAFFTARWAAVQQREKLRQELKLEFSVETAIVHLLEHPSYQTRSFDKIKRHIRGFEDDELRKSLVRAGAVVVREKDGEEMWGLLNLNKDAVK